MSVAIIAVCGELEYSIVPETAGWLRSLAFLEFSTPWINGETTNGRNFFQHRASFGDLPA